MLVKEDSVYLKLSGCGMARGPSDGVYRDDTRHLSKYCWNTGETVSLMAAVRENALHQHLSLVDAHRVQSVAMVRELRVRPDGFDDRWTFHNTSREQVSVPVSLDVEGEFSDLFLNALMREGGEKPSVTTRRSSQTLGLTAVASDAVSSAVHIRYNEPTDDNHWEFQLEPGELRVLDVSVTLTTDTRIDRDPSLPSYEDWRAKFAIKVSDSAHARALDQAVDDVRSLLLSTPFGPYPAAGMPWFVNIFGRDALITALMLQRWQPHLTLTVLNLLAEYQGKVVDPFREEEPGKILHEIRKGELSRTGKIPFGRYYGSADSTALFVMALDAYVATTGDVVPVTQLRHNWELALAWLATHQDEAGLVQFAPSGSGLAVQSWKDSSDSMNHADGTPAVAPLAVAEVQGYAFAAFQAGARFYRILGDEDSAQSWDARAEKLKYEFHTRFWIERLNTYAMALDGEGGPLEVLSSDPGHLLWCGIVPEDIAPALVETLMSPALWSGWGLRTLGADERRYNPVSYHNGSVWPHDTAIFAWGLSRYGFVEELKVVADALVACAIAQDTMQLPELVSGMPRLPGLPPVSYTHACRPQAWAAAGLILVSALTAENPQNLSRQGCC